MTDFCVATRAASDHSPLSSLVYIHPYELTAFEEYLSLNTGYSIKHTYQSIFSDLLQCELKEFDLTLKGNRLIWLTIRPPPGGADFTMLSELVNSFISCLPKNIDYFYSYEVKATDGSGLHVHICMITSSVSKVYKNARGKFNNLFPFNIPAKISTIQGGFYFQILPPSDEIWKDKENYLRVSKHHTAGEQIDLQVTREWRDKHSIPHFFRKGRR